MTAKLSQQEYITKCNTTHDNKYDYSLLNYKGGNNKIIVICPNHGQFTVLASNHMRKSGCPQCANSSRNNRVRLTTESFTARLNKRNLTYSPIQLISEYVNMKTKIKVQCVNGHEWETRPQDVLNGHGCAICAVKQREITALQLHGRRYHTQHTITDDVLENLANKEWLLDQHHTQQKTLQQIALDINVSPKCVQSYISKHNIEHKKFGNSQGERLLIEFLKEYIDSPILVNNKTIISPKELDIYIPNYNFAIEFNGIYWHSELNGKDKNYHLQKTIECTKQNIRLIHIFENELIHKRDIVESRLKSILQLNKRIYARKCSIVQLSSIEFTPFFDANHIQGSVSASICYGLVCEGNIVAAMSFGKSRFDKNIEYELIRYANALDINVVGGASRLFHHFKKHHMPNTIISYSDKRWNTGNLYKQLGFTFDHSSAPNYFYFHPTNYLKLESRQAYQKHKLQSILKTFNPSLTEWENMINNGYDRIWDCGNDVWICKL